MSAGTGVEDTGEAVASQHVLKLAGQLSGWNGRDIRPFPLDKMNVAIPEACHDRQPGTVENLDPGR